MLPLGTLVNVAAVLAGGTAGLLLHNRMPERLRAIVFQGLGLCVLVIGMDMALKMDDALMVILAVVLGGIVGEACRLEAGLESMASWLKAKVRSDSARFTEGMVTAFLIFCTGPMTILGAFDEGLRADPTLLFTKSMLDGCAAVAFAATYGVGVLFSVLPLFLYQGALTLLATVFQSVFDPAMIAQFSAVGGVLILGIGVNLLDLKRIRISNLLPALVVIVIFTLIFG